MPTRSSLSALFMTLLLACAQEGVQDSLIETPSDTPPSAGDEESGFNKEGFSHRVSLQVNAQDLNETLVNFPVLVKIPGDSPLHDHILSPQGDDIRFADSEGQELSYEIEFYAENQDSFLWLRLPEIPRQTQAILAHMYVGKPGLESAHHPEATFLPSIFKRVYHFNETFTGALGETAADASGQGDLTTLFGEDIISAQGFIGGGFEGLSKDAGFLSDLTSETILQGTVTLMLKMNSTYNGWRRVLSNETGPEISLSIASNTSRARTQFKVSIDGGETTTEWRSLNSVSVNGNTWNHLAWAWDLSNGVNMQPSLFIDGQLEEFSMGAPLTAQVDQTTEPYCVYCRLTTEDRMPTGVHDELRIYHNKMSATWIETELKSYQGELVEMGEVEDLIN